MRKEKRKADNQTARPSPIVGQGIETTTPTVIAPIVVTKEPIWHFNLAKRTEALFGNQSSLALPVVVFSAATALGLIAFTLNIHSVVFMPASGLAKQVGFLWAPNWTIVFLVILPMYLALLIDLVRCWKVEWRSRLLAVRGPRRTMASWESRVAAASYSYWAVLLVTVVVASGYNWTATHLIPLLNGDAGSWPVDWGRIAIFRPDIISVPSAIVFTGLVFLHNAFCSYPFFTGLIFLHAMMHDYLDVVKGLENGSKDEPHRDIEKISFSLMNGIFRCASLGMIITILMKLQSSFLQSESVNIFVWLVADIRSSFNLLESLGSNPDKLGSAPGYYYSFFCMLAIFGFFVNASVRIRLALTKMHLPKSGTLYPIPWIKMNGTMFLLVTSYLLIGAFTGFTIVLIFSLVLTVYLTIKPAFGPDSSIVER